MIQCLHEDNESQMSKKKFISILTSRNECHCCFFLTLSLPRPVHNEVCPVCIWEDDPIQNENPHFETGGNRVSLVQARLNFINHGACEPGLANLSRSPQEDELPLPTDFHGLNQKQTEFALRKVKTQILVIALGIFDRDIETLRGCSAITSIADPLKSDPVISPHLEFFDSVTRKASSIQCGGDRIESLKNDGNAVAKYRRQIRSEVDNQCDILSGILLDQLLREKGSSQS